MLATRRRPHSIDRLQVHILEDRTALGRAAARAAAAYLHRVISTQGSARIIFACSPSQDEFLAALTDAAECGVAIDWTKVTVFQTCEFIGLHETDLRGFRAYLHQHLLCRVPVARYHLLAGEKPHISDVCARYAALLAERPIDLVCLGVGENGHLALNDPPADFRDPARVKRVELALSCRDQQVTEGAFPTLASVPRFGLTVTLPVLLGARRISVHVPGSRKAEAVRNTLQGPVCPSCPASVLRNHPAAAFYLDAAAASAL